MTRGSRSRWQLLATLALLVVSLAVAAAVAEAALRLLGHRGAPQSSLSNVELVDDPILDWRYVPGSQVVEGRVVYRFNRAGFRDVDHEIENASARSRVLVLGDSVTEGRGVVWEEVFAPVLQARLGAEFEVINLAQSGLNTPQEVHLLEKAGLAYEPELVVLNFVLNDCDFYTQLQAARRYTAERDAEIGLLFGMPIDPRVKALLKSSALIYFLKERVEELSGRVVGEDPGDYHLGIWSRDENRKKVQDGFDRLRALSESHRFRVAVIIWPLLAEYETYPFAEIHAWVREQAEARGLPVIDLLPLYARLPFRELQVTPEDGVHPNGRGHEIGAEAFVAWLRGR